MDEIKLKRLERQQIRYEKDIQYLYKIIESLKLESNRNSEIVHDLQMQLSGCLQKLRHSEKICDEREKFILFRESQLLELEDEVYNLKQRIATLVIKKEAIMADTHTDPPLEHLDNDQLKLLVADHAQRLVNRIGGHTPEYTATNEQWRAEIVGAIKLLDKRMMGNLTHALYLEIC
jgi:chromosome segregation ATPase